MLASRSSLGQRMQEDEQCAATEPFRHCCIQSGWFIPRMYCMLSRVGSAIFRMQVAEGCDNETMGTEEGNTITW